MPVSVALLIVRDSALAVGAARDDRDGVAAAQKGAQCIGVVALVGDEIAGSLQTLQKRRGRLHVGDVAGCQHEGEGSAEHVGQGVELGGLAATRWADGLCLRPPLPPWAERWALT